MIQDIAPHQFNNAYKHQIPQDSDPVLCFQKGQILLKEDVDVFSVPCYKQIKGEVYFLFEQDGIPYFLAMDEQNIEGYAYQSTFVLRSIQPQYMRLIAVTGYHLYQWYTNTRYCGHCGQPLIPSTTERAMTCPACNTVFYPRISPAIIVGVIHKDRILMTRYAGRSYKGRALVAGFCEIGETPEETVQREVMEEVGLKVKNIRYYKSQPWGFSGDLLLGYFADLDGDTQITIDEEELARARFVSREEIDEEDDELSLTREMVLAFKKDVYPR